MYWTCTQVSSCTTSAILVIYGNYCYAIPLKVSSLLGRKALIKYSAASANKNFVLVTARGRAVIWSFTDVTYYHFNNQEEADEANQGCICLFR